MPSRLSPLRVATSTISASAEGTYRCLEETFSEVQHPAGGSCSRSVIWASDPSGCCSQQIDQTGPAAAAWGKPSILLSSRNFQIRFASRRWCDVLPAAHLSPPLSPPESTDDIIGIIFTVRPELEMRLLPPAEERETPDTALGLRGESLGDSLTDWPQLLSHYSGLQLDYEWTSLWRL